MIEEYRGQKIDDIQKYGVDVLQSVQIGKAILTISMSSVKSFTFLALRVPHLLCFARSVLLLILALLVLAVLLHVLFQSRKM